MVLSLYIYESYSVLQFLILFLSSSSKPRPLDNLKDIFPVNPLRQLNLLPRPPIGLQLKSMVKCILIVSHLIEKISYPNPNSLWYFERVSTEHMTGALDLFEKSPLQIRLDLPSSFYIFTIGLSPRRTRFHFCDSLPSTEVLPSLFLLRHSLFLRRSFGSRGARMCPVPRMTKDKGNCS